MGNAVTTGSELNSLTRTLGMCTLALFIKYVFVLFWSVNMANHPPEDKPQDKPQEDKLVDANSDEAMKRKERILANDVENIPIHMVLQWACYLMIVEASDRDGSSNLVKALQALVIIYLLGRYGHTLCYAFGLQPWRSIFFIFAQLSALITAFLVAYAAFQVKF